MNKYSILQLKSLLFLAILVFGLAQVETSARSRVKIVDNYLVADNGEKLRGGDFRVYNGEINKINADYNTFKNYFQDQIRIANLNTVRITVRYPNWNENPQNHQLAVAEVIKWALELDIYVSLNLHTHYGQVINVNKCNEFWSFYSNFEVNGVALKNNPNLIFELHNEPIYQPASQMKDNQTFINAVNQTYSHARSLAPNTHLILVSAAQTTHVPPSFLSKLTSVNWSNASIGWHSYSSINDITADWANGDQMQQAGFPIINTEMKSKAENNEGNMVAWSQLMHNIKLGEQRPTSWFHWDPKLNWNNANAGDHIFDFRFFYHLAENNIPFWFEAGSFSNSQSIGEVDSFGYVSHNNGTYTIDASGADISNAADEFFFVSNEQNGDETIVAKVASIQNTNGSAKSGLMMRENLTSGSKNVSVLVTPSNGVRFQYRSNAGSGTAAVGLAGYSAPCWVRLTRSGNAFTGSVSNDGTNWTQVGSAIVAMNNTIRGGLAATSRNDGVISQSVISNVSDGNSGGGDPGTSDGIYRLQNASTGKWLKDSGSVIMADTVDTGDSTKWELIEAGALHYLKNVETGQYLSFGSGDPNTQSTTDTKTEWDVVPINNAFYIESQYALNNGGSPRLKDYNNDVVLHSTASTGALAQWTLVPVETDPEPETGSVRLQNASTGKWLKGDGPVIMADTNNTGDFTKWELVEAGALYNIRNVGTGQYLSFGSGDPVAQSSTDAKTEWDIVPVNNAFYIESQYALDNGGSPRLKDYSNDAVLHSSASTGTLAQWILVPTN